MKKEDLLKKIKSGTLTRTEIIQNLRMILNIVADIGKDSVQFTACKDDNGLEFVKIQDFGADKPEMSSKDLTNRIIKCDKHIMNLVIQNNFKDIMQFIYDNRNETAIYALIGRWLLTHLSADALEEAKAFVEKNNAKEKDKEFIFVEEEIEDKNKINWN